MLKKIKKYISEKNIEDAQNTAKDQLRKIKIYKIGKFDSSMLTNKSSIGKEY